MLSEEGPPGRILLVEDDEVVSALHNAVLLGAGFETETTETLAGLRRHIGAARFDVVLLDLRLPDGNALDMITEIRRTTSAGIIVASSSGDRAERWAGLENGADEFLQKPVHPRELVARVRNLVNRLQNARAATAEAHVHRFEGWTCDLIARRISFPGGDQVHLTENEFRLLDLLIRNSGKPVHRDRLVAALADGDVTTRAVDKIVYRMRMKLHAHLGHSVPLIETVHGFGYCFVVKRL